MARLKYPRENLLKRYGITREIFDSSLEHQGGKCAICRDAFIGTAIPNVDHDHKTGKFRALLCGHCNAMIGYARESVPVLEAAIGYIMKHSGQPPAIIHEETAYLDPVKDVLSGWNGLAGADAARGSI